MLTNGGLLLEHFARLATNIAGTAAAIVGVLGRRNEQGLRRASYGLSPGQMTAIQDIEEILDRGHSLTIIPDLAQDGRFGGETPAFERLGFRFLVHMKLISPGGERVGFILLLDEIPRQGLTGDQVTTLGHIASMVMADRQREQRHLHLMHVADRALRVDRMLRLVSEANSCADALTNLLEALCRFHGAAVGQIWQLIRPDKPLVEISRYHHDQQSGYVFQSLQPLITLNEMTMDAIRRNTPHAIEFSRLEGFQPPNDSDGSGFTGHVCIPIWAQQQRFGISLAFTTENTGLDAVVADITSLGDTIRPALIQKVTEERMRFAAHHDDLTQLSNRLMFQERLRKAIAGARSGKQSFALLCLDLDGFKLINDTHGHGFGDSLLVGVAQRLRESVRETDTVARMGGDEFAIIQLTDNQPEDAIALAKRLVDIVTQPFELAGRQALVGVSIGIALYPNHGESPDLLLRDADQALYRAKKAGRKTWALFDPDVECSSQEPFLVEQDLKDAITRGDFTLAYQPVCDFTFVAHRRVRGAAALAASASGLDPAGPVHPPGGEKRPDRPARPLGAGNRLRRSRQLGPPGLAVRQSVAAAVSPARFARTDRRRAEPHRPAALAPRTGSDRGAVAGRIRPRPANHPPAPGSGHPDHARRLRHRLRQHELFAPLSVQRHQDRQVLHSRHLQR